MLQLEREEPHSPRSKSTASTSTISYRFSSPLAKYSIFAILAVLLVAYGRGLLWSSSKPFTLDTHNLSILQSLCHKNSNGPNVQQPIVPHSPMISHETLSEHSTLRYLAAEISPDKEIPLETWSHLPTRGVFYMIVQNDKLQSAREAIRSLEDRFNHQHRYPWVLLNDQHFTAEFRKYASAATKAPMFFGKIDLEAWSYPSFIDIQKAEKSTASSKDSIYMGSSLSYRQRSRYHAGLFFHHSLFKNTEYVWRVEPESTYSCNMPDIDPFLDMKENKKSMGFILTSKESPKTVPGLWKVTRAFIDDYSSLVVSPDDSVMPWIVDEKGDYNMCHMTNSFEIVNMDFYRSSAYQKYFEYLDRSGGFFYGRWSDAPVRSMAVAMFLTRDQIHYFNKLGYSHTVNSHCPFQKNFLDNCICSVEENYDLKSESCTLSLLSLVNRTVIYEMADFAHSFANNRLPFVA
ncbi:nucleotide-diphospho-sugar transferase [Spinellus fusiger]|nr:nucleotide-diphospho-sugar transferase [Spinellus fusiger]